MTSAARRWVLHPSRWLQFRMRTLLAFIAACAVVAKFAGEINGYYAEQAALTELRSLGPLIVEGSLIFL